MAITSQTNESINERKHYDNEDAVCVPLQQNSSVRLYRSKNVVELEERIQSTTNFFDPSRVAQNLTCRILAKKKQHAKGPAIQSFSTKPRWLVTARGTIQTNESIKESKHYDNEDAACVPSEQNSSVRLYRSKNFVERKERIQSITQNLTCRILAKKHTKGPAIQGFLRNQDD